MCLLDRDRNASIRGGHALRRMPDHLFVEPVRSDQCQCALRARQGLLEWRGFQQTKGGVDGRAGHAMIIELDLARVERYPHPDAGGAFMEPVVLLQRPPELLKNTDYQYPFG